MTVEQIMQLISSLGFPIVVCIFLAWYIVNRDNQHKEEVSKLTDAVNNNTLVMQKLIDKMDNGSGV